MVRAVQDMSIGVGMGMDRSTVAGQGERTVRNKARFERRQYSDSIKKFLKPCFKVERDILSIKNPGNDGASDGGAVFGSLLMSAFGFIGFFTVPGRREEFIPFIKGMVSVSPKPVDEIIVRAERRKRVYRASDQRGEDAVGFQTFYPCGKGSGCKINGDQKKKEDEGTEDLRLV